MYTIHKKLFFYSIQSNLDIYIYIYIYKYMKYIELLYYSVNVFLKMKMLCIQFTKEKVFFCTIQTND